MAELNDSLNLQENEKNEIKRMKSALDNRALFNYIFSGELKKLYATVYPDYKTLILKKNPTYYRKESAIAMDYSMKDTNPVIVFLNPSITQEGQFIEYTGMSTQIFLEKLNNDEIIPTRDYYYRYTNVEYSNKFYMDFFKEWNKKASDRPPVFANTLSATFSGERDPPWKTEYLYLMEQYPFLAGTVKTHPELGEKRTLDFFAERFFWMRTIGRQEYVDDILFLLNKYSKNQTDKQLFDNVIAMTKYGHQIFSAHKYYAMGSTVTFSVNDYRETVELINRLIQDRKNRNVFIDSLIGISLPLSCFLEHNLKKSLIRSFDIIFPSKKNLFRDNESDYHKFQKDSDWIEGREQFTDNENKLQENLEKVSKGHFISASKISDNREELAESLHNYNQCVLNSKMRIGDYVKTSIEYCNTFELTTILSCGLESAFETALESLKLMPALINHIQTRKWQEYYNDTVLPCTGVPIAVWTSGETVTWKYT
jgi:hypothetical protein